MGYDGPHSIRDRERVLVVIHVAINPVKEKQIHRVLMLSVPYVVGLRSNMCTCGSQYDPSIVHQPMAQV